MVRLSLRAIFFSNKNIDLAYKIKKICRGVQINVINAIDLIDLTLKVMEVKPHIVFFDLSTIKLDRQTLELFMAKEEYFIANPILIYENDEDLVEYENLDIVYLKPCEIEDFLIKEEAPYKMKALSSEQQNYCLVYLNSQINDHLFKMGFSAKHVGYSYILESIKVLIKRMGPVGSLNNEVYPLIAAKFGTNISNVERGIRNAILCAWNTCSKQQFEKGPCNFFTFFKNRPTNREFICLYIEKILDYWHIQDTLAAK